jgi:hypothetical protein
MDVLTILVTGMLCITCFLIGASVRQKIDKGEEVKLPTVNPVELYHEHKEKEEKKLKASQREVLHRNIERYNGTSLGQEDIPM